MRILVGVDLRSEPERVVADATPWIAGLGAEADLVYVGAFDGDGGALDRELARLPDAHRGKGLLTGGDPAAAIVELAGSYELIAVGTAGRTGLERLWEGSVAERVVRHATRPVLVARGPAPGPEPRVLAAVDLEDSPSAALDRAAPWLERLGATVDLLYVDTARLPLAATRDPAAHVLLEEHWQRSEVGYLARLVGVAEALRPARRGQGFVAAGAPAEAILERARAYDLVLMGTHGRTGLARAVLGSVAEHVLRLAPCSVLVVP